MEELQKLLAELRDRNLTLVKAIAADTTGNALEARVRDLAANGAAISAVKDAIALAEIEVR